MRLLGVSRFASVCVGLFCLGCLSNSFAPALARAQQGAAADPVAADERAIYAAVLDAASTIGAGSQPLVAEMTSTFACGADACNKLSIGGCNGLRGTETPEARLAIVKRDLPALQPSTSAEFLKVNDRCSVVPSKLNSRLNYHLTTDMDIPQSWSYTSLVYFSRVAFSADHKQALVAVGLMSTPDTKASNGRYFVLGRQGDGWSLNGSSVIWKLKP
ncbi:hypothetical protein [Acidipila sp. EB88]|uniref:hypothetical protein n=1 Tax=Acidipila sp. EB88 TaxID=2305226 RepID=UPI000F5F0D28|nr:hypothetical protein [Acidipila sp. EB88]RRA49522.1 hypothetical protein D1Y84_15820 [Acidipila sp. EB88]